MSWNNVNKENYRFDQISGFLDCFSKAFDEKLRVQLLQDYTYVIMKPYSMKKLTDFQDSINKQTIQLFVKSIVKFQFFKDYKCVKFSRIGSPFFLWEVLRDCRGHLLPSSPTSGWRWARPWRRPQLFPEGSIR